MPAIVDESRLVLIELDADDLAAIADGEQLTVECPHTGETICLTKGNVEPRECECCGKMVHPEDPITPSMRSNVDRLREGGTAVYQTAHTEEDVTIILRAEHDVASGWL